MIKSVPVLFSFPITNHSKVNIWQMDFPLIGFINIYQMLFLVQGLVLAYAVIFNIQLEQFFGTLISINYCYPNYPLNGISPYVHFWHSITHFFRQELLVTHSVSRNCKYGQLLYLVWKRNTVESSLFVGDLCSWVTLAHELSSPWTIIQALFNIYFWNRNCYQLNYVPTNQEFSAAHKHLPPGI